MFVSLASIWGGSFVAIEMGLGSVPPLWFAGLRYLLAGAVISGVAAATGRFRPKDRSEWLSIALVGSFVVAGYHGLLYLGTAVISGSISSVIVSLSPVLTTVAAGALLADESPGVVDGLGLLFGLAGVVVIANPGGSSVPLSGVALVFVGVALFATGSVGLRALDSGLPAASMQGWAMLVGSTMLVGGAVLRGERFPTGVVSGDSALPFLYLVFGAAVVGYLIYFDLLSRIGPVRVNYVAYLEPVTAAMAAWAVLGRAPTTTTATGFLLVAAGFALATVDDPLERLGLRSEGVVYSDLSDNGSVEVHYAD
ncbi:DMT family transporter [Halolamina sp. C58]|uniref:DMT family transporter n=1 Tax=Halolamina sp. C58 TaxID=3421640 RepID=UPI003EBF53B0